MRMWDITILILCFELAIGFVGGLGLFEHQYYTQSQQSVGELNGYMHGDMNATNNLITSSKTTNSDYFALGTMMFAAFNMLLSLLGSVVFFYPHLVNTFMIPVVLAAPLQVMIYVMYVWGIVQFLSGRQGGTMQ